MPILDSDILIDYLREKQPAVSAIQALLQNGAVLQTTAFNYFEVFFGAITFEENAQKIEKTQFFLDSLEILFPDLASFRKSAEIQLALRKKGKMIGPVDLFIAGIAVTHQYVLHTKNIRHFSHVPGLRLAPY